MKNWKLLSTLFLIALVLSLVSVTGCAKRLAIVKKDPAPSAQQSFLTQGDVSFPEATTPNREPVVVEEPPVMAESDIQDSGSGDAPMLSIALQDVFFDFDRAVITEAGAVLLKQNAGWLAEHRNVGIRIEGTTDERGTSVYNLALGERRAQAVKSYLISLGVDGRRIETISYGEEKQFCHESNESCWAQNRRGHFVTSTSAKL